MKLWAVVPFIVLVAAATTMLVYLGRHSSPTIDTIWVINLDKDKERMDNIHKKTQAFSNLMNRWPATYGKTEPIEAAYKDGVGHIISKRGYEPGAPPSDIVNRNEGAVGCWLSHKRLLTHIASLNLPGHWGHLITEDDLEFQPNFMDIWEKRRHSIPNDWDIVYLSINLPNGKPIDGKLLRGVKAEKGNWGTHAYMVKHSSLKNRILPKLRHMSHEIDVQLNMYFNDLNVYIMSPEILHVNEDIAAKSNILVH